MSLKGYPSNKRIKAKEQSTENFATIAPIDANRAGLDVLPKALYPVSALDITAETVDPTDFPGTRNPKLRIVKATGHSVRKGDVLRFTTGTNKGMELVAAVVETDFIYLSGELLADPDTDDFKHLRHLTLTINEDGQLEVSAGALRFIKDAVSQQVIKDTVDSANTVGLPVEIVGSSGAEINITAGDINVQTSATGLNPDSMRIGDGTNELEINASSEALVKDTDATAELVDINTELDTISAIDFSTETTLDALLTAFNNEDFASQTTLAALLTAFNDEDFASQTTLAALLTAFNAEDFASQTTLNNLLTAFNAEDFATSAKQDDIITALTTIAGANAERRVIQSSFTSSATIPTATRLASVTVPTTTKALELEVLAKTGDNFTAYDAATGGNVIGRFTQAGGKLPVSLAAGEQIHLQSDTGLDITATDLTINLIGVDL